MEQLNHFAETNVDTQLKSAINRYVATAKFSERTNLEEIIQRMPIYARAPLFALYFMRVRGVGKKQANFELLVRLFQIAVRIYERHVLYGTSNRFIGTDRFNSKSVKRLLDSLGRKIQFQSEETPDVDNDLYYKEVVLDLRQHLPNFHVGEMLRDYCAMKVIQFVALYAQDVQNLDLKRPNVSVCEEQLYKQGWGKSKLLTAKSQIFENNLGAEELSEFFENYSLR